MRTAPTAQQDRGNHHFFLVGLWGGLIAAFMAVPALAAGASGADQSELSGAELVRALRGGGYVIYLLHAATDHASPDLDRENLDDCANQRNLSAKGREQALAIGQAIKALGIQVARVESSPYCRCVDTGKLAFGHVAITDELSTAISQSRSETVRSAESLRRKLGEAPPPGANTVLVSHTANLKEATGIWPDPEGVAVIFRPDSATGFSYVGTVLPEQWATLSRTR